MTARDGTMPGQLSCELTFSDLLFVYPGQKQTCYYYFLYIYWKT